MQFSLVSIVIKHICATCGMLCELVTNIKRKGKEHTMEGEWELLSLQMLVQTERKRKKKGFNKIIKFINFYMIFILKKIQISDKFNNLRTPFFNKGFLVLSGGRMGDSNQWPPHHEIGPSLKDHLILKYAMYRKGRQRAYIMEAEGRSTCLV